VTLRPASFKYLLSLAVARILSNVYSSGWIHKLDIQPGQNQIKYIWQLRSELSGHFNEDVRAVGALIDNDCNGHYRLNVSLGDSVISIDNALEASGDHDICQTIAYLKIPRTGPSQALRPYVPIRTSLRSARSLSVPTAG